MKWIPYAAGVAALLVIWFVFIELGLKILPGTGNRKIPKLIEGADGRLSTSKFQWFLWMIVAVFSYAVVFTSNVMHNHFGALGAVPQNLIIAIGLSTATMAGAKKITVHQVANKKVDKVMPKAGEAKAGALITDDEGYADLSKIQLIAWTVIAIGVYLVDLVHQVNTAGTTALQLPDIDTSLMVLMGLGQGAYLGKKAVSTAAKPAPHLSGLLPSSAAPGTKLTLVGTDFGKNSTSDVSGSTLTIDTKPYTPVADPDFEWKQGRITFTIPAKQINGQPWGSGQRILIGVIVDAQESNPLPFTVI